VIGSTTVGSLQSGLYYGYLGLVDGILDRLLEEMGPQTTVVATGGLAALIGKGSKHIKHVDDLLTLDGLRLIWERNSEAKPSRDAASGKDSAASTTHGRKPRSR
jgi:type III pantothenate kinase